MNQTVKKSDGFTIVELIIATAVFASVLLLCTNGIIYIGKLFYKGVTSNTLQETARDAMDQVKNDFELSGGYYVAVPDGPNASKGFCIGDHLYTYKINTKISASGTGHALVVSDVPNCDISTTVTAQNITVATGRELLGANMRLTKFTVNPVDQLNGRPQSLEIRIAVVSGDDDLISATGLCNSGAGSQFCASSELYTFANRRLRQ